MKITSMAMIFCLLLPFVPFSAGSVPPQSEWALLKSIAPGSSVQVISRGGKSVSGTLVSVTDSTLEMTRDGRPVTFQATDVARVDLFRGRALRKATLIGVGVGTGAGAAIGAVAGAQDDFFGKGPWIAAMASVGAVLGAVVGVTSGAKRRKETVYQAAGTR